MPNVNGIPFVDGIPLADNVSAKRPAQRFLISKTAGILQSTRRKFVLMRPKMIQTLDAIVAELEAGTIPWRPGYKDPLR
jgi:hypothetical protein